MALKRAELERQKDIQQMKLENLELKKYLEEQKNIIPL